MLMRLFTKYVLKHRNNKFLYYSRGILRELFPKSIFQHLLSRKLTQINEGDLPYLRSRLEYYNKLEGATKLTENIPPLSTMSLPKRGKVYYLDAVEYTRFFNQRFRTNFLFGDITHVPDQPSIVKSRPIGDHNENSVLLKLNKVRHFIFVDDDIPYREKLDKLVWRGAVGIEHKNRIHFLQTFFNHSFCDVGKTNVNNLLDDRMKERLSINQQLRYKFILSMEGNDVATNLKWVMSSQSVAVMPTPRYETWFMEGRLIPDHHYIHIKDDFSDLEEKLVYYSSHPQEAMQISKNANAYVRQFKDKKNEELLSLLVLEKYFVMTGQMEPISSLQSD